MTARQGNEMRGGTSIAVTGMGAICAAGSHVEEIWESAAGGRLRAEWTGQGDARTPVCRIAELPSLDGADTVNLRRADRCTKLALIAALEAHGSARLEQSDIDPDRLGVIIGTSRGPISTWQETSRRQSAGERQLPSLLVDGTLASLSGTISATLGARGTCLTVSATCASAAHAIALGAEQLCSGLLDAVIVGGSDSPLHPALLEQFRETRLVGTHADPRRACRPFDRTRNGITLGEGAGILILETLEHARRRGVAIQAMLAGWGLTADAADRAAISGEGRGLQRAIRLALGRAHIEPESIDYINAHGTGTKQNDICESQAIAAIVGAGKPCSSTKPVTGHCAGATPALEAVLSIRAIQESFIPPTATCESPDPECPIDPIPATGRRAVLNTILSNSLGIWGNNAALVFAKADQSPG
jgi:3-oxoacyl-[acyl-carrier-protein] synthase II